MSSLKGPPFPINESFLIPNIFLNTLFYNTLKRPRFTTIQNSLHNYDLYTLTLSGLWRGCDDVKRLL